MQIPQTKDIQTVINILKQGRVVAFPTGTSYGLAVDCLQGHALQRLRRLKNRPADKAFSIFLSFKLWQDFFELTSQGCKMLKSFQQKPITVLVRPKKILAHLAADGLVALRMTDHPLMDALAVAFGSPLTATSANRTGQAPCFDPLCIQQAFKNPQSDGTIYDLSLGCILDGGSLGQTKPSTIIKIVNRSIKVIRPGAYEFSSSLGKSSESSENFFSIS